MIHLPVDPDLFATFAFDRQLDIIVDLFETSLKNGSSPAIAEFVSLVAPSSQSRLMRELILVEREFLRVFGDALEKGEINKSDTVEGKGSKTVDANPAKHQDPNSDLPSHFDRYAIRKLLGRGSHGIVYEAEDLEIRRPVALKLGYSANGGEPHREFATEASNATRVDHPSVVKILDVGVHRGTNFMVSELIEGVSLCDFAASQNLSDNHRVRIVADIASGIGAAHRCGVIHRDLKPSNIMMETKAKWGIGDQSESEKAFSLDDYRVRILDFGIAKMLDRQTRRTLQGDIVGTPHYMSPEQASGNSANVDRRSDVFSLGVILYELLCGQLPFDGSEMVVLSGIRDLKVPPIRSIRSDIPAALEQITHQCLGRNPAQRYQSATELEADLRKWLAGTKPIALRNRELKRFALGLVSLVSVCLLLGIATLGIRNRWFVSDHFNRSQANSKDHLVAWLERADSSALLLWNKGGDSQLKIAELESMLDRNGPSEPSWRWRLAQLCLPSQAGVEARELTQLAKDFLANVEEKDWSNIAGILPDGFIHELEGFALESQKPRDRETLFLIVADRWGHVSETDGLIRLLKEAKIDELPLVISAIVKCANGSSGSFRETLLDAFDRTAGNASGKLLHGQLQSESENQWRAKLGLIAFGLEDWERVDRILSASIDPRARNYFIYWFDQCGFSIESLLSRFLDSDDDWKSTAVLGCMSMIPSHKISVKQRNDFLGVLKEAYIHHASSAVHRSARKLLTDWGHSDVVLEADAIAEFREIRHDRNWFVTPFGMPMNVVRGPQEFWYGPPKDAKGIRPGGLVQLNSSFAIAENLVTETEYSKFDPMRYPNPTESPATKVTWIEAIAYCDWLNRQEVIEDRNSIEFLDEMSIRFSETTAGYRLANSWEWECFFRAGTETSFSIGEIESDYFANLIGSPQRSLKYFGPSNTDILRTAEREWISTDYDSTRLFVVTPCSEQLDIGDLAVALGGFFLSTKSLAAHYVKSIVPRFNSQAGIRLCRTVR